MSKGKWKIEKFTIDRVDFSALSHGRTSPAIGEVFTRLTRNGEVIMSDTPDEIRDIIQPCVKAKGSCLINGLGLGVILKNILLKPVVTDVTVVEISQDLIDLLKPYYSDSRVEIVCADAFTYKPSKGKRYQMVWHDIWDNICADNFPSMTKLKRKYGCKCEWQGCWCEYQCKKNR